MSRRVFVLVAVCALTFLAGLGRPAITDSDEGFYAESAREMVESGDWLTPHFNYVDRFEKPILYYWLAAGAYVVLGVGEAAARLPSALAGLGLSLLTFFIGRRVFDTTTGFLAGLVMATSFGHVAMARQALPDLLLALFVTLATWSAIAAWLDPPASRRETSLTDRRLWTITAAVATGCAVLTKGPVGLVLPALVVGPLLCWEYLSGRSAWRLRASDLALSVAIFLVVVVPWFVAMTTVHGAAYLDRFFIAENLDRFATVRYNDPRAWWYYLPIVAGGMLPWSPYMLLWVPAARSFFRSGKQVDVTTLRLTWWALAPLLFYTVSVGKQPRYILPMLAPLALLLGNTLRERLHRRSSSDHLFACCAVLSGLVLALVGVLVYRAQPLFTEWHPRVITLVAIAVVASGIGVCATSVMRRWAPAALTMATVVTTLGAHYVVLATPGPAPVERMALMITSASTGEQRYGRHAVFNRNLVFYTRRPFVELPILRAARGFLQEPDPVLCVLKAEDVDRLEAGGMSLRQLGEITYLNTGSLNLRMLIDPNPDRLERAVLVSNR